MDPVIVLFARVTLGGGRRKWIRSVQRAIHTHDVRSMALCGPKLLSGGLLSCYVAVSFELELNFAMHRCRRVHMHFILSAQISKSIPSVTTGNLDLSSLDRRLLYSIVLLGPAAVHPIGRSQAIATLVPPEIVRCVETGRGG